MDKLEDMKYAELQRLAKKNGIKANMKADKLLKALKEYFAAEAENNEEPSKPENKDATTKSRQTPGKSPKAANTTVDKSSSSENKAGSLSNDSSVQGTPKGSLSQSTRKSTPGFKSLSRVETPVSGVKRLSVKPPTPQSANYKKTPRPRSSVPTSAQSKRESIKSVSTPDSRRSSGRKRSNTYTLPEGTVPSPTVKEMMESMKDGMTKEELKNSLQTVLEKNAQSTDISLKSSSTQSSIPRFAAFAMKKKAEAAKTITPGNKNWAKIHQRQFNKMDSLDVYLEKKRKRTESISASVKKARLLAEQTKAAVNSLRSCMSPKDKDTNASLFKTPVPHTGVPFVPKVTSTSKMNTNFSSLKSQGLQNKTPTAGKENIRKSPRVASAKKSAVTPGVDNRKSTGSFQNRKIAVAAQNRKSRVSSGIARKSTSNTENLKETPFKLGTALNQTLPTSQQKAKFDLKASLSRPMTWKPHTGKLKPLVEDNLFGQKAGAFRVDPKNVNIKIKNQNDRRNANKSRQADKRSQMKMKRRGINV